MSMSAMASSHAGGSTTIRLSNSSECLSVRNLVPRISRSRFLLAAVNATTSLEAIIHTLGDETRASVSAFPLTPESIVGLSTSAYEARGVEINCLGVTTRSGGKRSFHMFSVAVEQTMMHFSRLTYNAATWADP
ncbi:unknown [Singapore grouper iridovirus]|uniref:Uncharacterized protein n=1 Tax=Singapore grouper iridovirus TaxID=262968 RepID=Q5YFR3_9VIRU|nr:hypothetical protein ORF002R [Singapore grouper iridovirus]AAS18017.1 unknown [Singapore grouper iridovirus]WAU86711.1 hypothetical protein ORF002R [Singapore grouper iridovirus]